MINNHKRYRSNHFLLSADRNKSLVKAVIESVLTSFDLPVATPSPHPDAIRNLSEKTSSKEIQTRKDNSPGIYSFSKPVRPSFSSNDVLRKYKSPVVIQL